MKIEVWSDFVCPFCYIGKRRLENAMEKFPHKEQVTLEYKSYQLDPTAEHIPGKNFYETFSELKGIPLEQVKTMNQQVGQQAATVGLNYNFDDMKYANTFDAHRVAKYAEEKGKGKEVTERFLHAYFTESELLSDYDTLIKLAAEVDLDKEEVEHVLQSDKYRNKVNEDIDVARQIGVQGVPFFVFNEKYAVSGAQPAEVFEEVLNKVWEEEKEKPILQSLNPKKSKTSFCTDEGCN
ncbi:MULTISPECIES: DsbA family oxidoreductase [Oceanobacillus]|uniref:DsbA family oxidoreductase n=1 Tax=Oceanobacillus profundus TaxID=372463 RepID=A0A417YEG2_9BACI|nr:DsbA family oxidoreductase [Oceanobacillus profundus]MBR3118139.1 DsbA family oxidoreductase [Oceanobacillus sp.]PAE28483.1 disulfide bond formation protein DsbA [Paenibacillus sp. 7884-2]RHW31048.1 DsbA family oxidoreductase [Oceanobacillus profundus]